MSSSSSRSIAMVGAAAAAVAVVGVALTMSLGGSEPSVAVSGTSAVESSAPATTAGPATTASSSIPQTTEAPEDSDPGDLLMTFGMAWTTADWDLMRTVADQSVLDAAEEWSIAGGIAEINAGNLDVVLDSCFEDESGATRCQFLYLPPEGFALIFSAALTATDQGLVITGLIPSGDAG